MKQAFLAILFALPLSLCVTASSGDTLQVGDLLLALQKVQDEVARGDDTSLKMQDVLLEQLKTALEDPLFDPENDKDWSVVAIGYALNGAQPKAAMRLLSRVNSSDANHDLAQAVSVYVAGNMKEAALLFNSVFLDHLDPRLAPYAALAMGTSYLETEVEKSVSSFEHAALLGSGTLVEEVALRRLAIASVKIPDAAMFERAANLYIRRYSKSPYAIQFFTHFAEHAPVLLDPGALSDIMSIVAAQRPDSSTPVFLALADAAATSGKTSLVSEINERYLETAKQNKENPSDRLKVYGLISALVKIGTVPEAIVIPDIDRSKISETERSHFEKATAVVAEILKPLSEVDQEKSKLARLFKGEADVKNPSGETGKDGKPDQVDNSLDAEIAGRIEIAAKSAKDSIALADKLLLE